MTMYIPCIFTAHDFISFTSLEEYHKTRYVPHKLLISECKIEIDAEYNGEQNVMYRCGDSEVCSLSCSKSRICKIIAYDPYLNNPMYWQIISDIKPKHIPIKRSSSKKTLTDDNFVINIVELDIIPEEEANQDDVCDRYYHCYTLRDTLITLLLQSMIYAFDVIIEIFY